MSARIVSFLLVVAALSLLWRSAAISQLPTQQDAIRDCAPSDTEGTLLRRPDAIRRHQRKPLPFRIPRDITPNDSFVSGVLQVPNGFLMGVDQGEWDGGLWWLASTGVQHSLVFGGNVFIVVSIHRTVVAVTGLAHLDFNQGQVASVVFNPRTKKWEATSTFPLDGSPQAVFKNRNDLFVRTDKSQFSYRDGMLNKICSVR